ncbi:hypothetical protein RA307_16395 [Xanthobacteraceae bacterium Astr-EGSB]|uniref:hypothetical protein n=1 Tax=Astrobacterium formosum TaxID=3069710 RepID=UPI0027B6EA78|nr:hypothetical protein [Xanthobacteraceae bacterium Astr-EGSB]
MKTLAALAVSSLILTSAVATAMPLCAPGQAAGTRSSVDTSAPIGLRRFASIEKSGFYAMATPSEDGVDPDVRIRQQLHRDRVSN